MGHTLLATALAQETYYELEVVEASIERLQKVGQTEDQIRETIELCAHADTSQGGGTVNLDIVLNILDEEFRRQESLSQEETEAFVAARVSAKPVEQEPTSTMFLNRAERRQLERLQRAQNKRSVR